ncbi:MAG: hydrogenase [Acidobacteria bacterium]|nr:MAG: hydrogenase [Acidobacteriota bacterium]PYU41857.1 MAG: hydrogenase [Acidobacteriota bacterium]PYU60659.1 MAG: hydrogenase [Acidobacteriota bacterium]PYU70764.1 MAG: hydrogenase [Acidobacteriota bacterium]
MFKIIQKTIRTGIVTKAYPAELAHVSEHFRGRPHFDFEKWTDARPAAEVCPTGAISLRDSHDSREVTVDYGLCVFCGLCAEASSDKAVRITQEFELATKNRRNLVLTAEYTLNADHTHRQLGTVRPGSGNVETDVKIVGQKAHETIRKVLGRSLAIREVDAGSCNGCEVEIVALNNPIHDIERFGIQFVASPRHADMLLVTGPVTRNMELALLKTYRAMPEPKVVVAVGACGISGGIFGKNYASLGGVDNVLPVDVYIPGCPPRPQALLHGILLAVGRLGEKLYHERGG